MGWKSSHGTKGFRGREFEHYKIAEWEVSAFKSYKAIHMPGDNTDYSESVDIGELPQILFDYGISMMAKANDARTDTAKK